MSVKATVEWHDEGWREFFKSRAMLGIVEQIAATTAAECDTEARGYLSGGDSINTTLYYSGAKIGKHSAVAHVSTSEKQFHGVALASRLEQKHHILARKLDKRKRG